ncbi:TPA: DUF2946 domain-containing protein [Citrobacter farmeri]
MQGRIRTNHIAAWLALIAVAMLFVAPAISRTIAHRTGCQHITHAMPGTMSGIHHDMAMSAICEPSSLMDQQMMSGKAMSPMEEIACGYCQLLVQLPFIQFAIVFLLWLLLLFVLRFSLIPLICVTLFQPWAPQRARAPPAVFQSSF